MATPPRKLIMDNLQTTFEGVTAAAGYKTTVVTVQSLARGYFDVATAEKPFIGYVPGIEIVQHQPGNNIYCTLNMSIIGHISGETLSDRQDMLNDLADDLIAVLNVDTTRGSNAISTTITQFETDEGDPDAKGDGSLLMQAQIKYVRSTSSS